MSGLAPWFTGDKDAIAAQLRADRDAASEPTGAVYASAHGMVYGIHHQALPATEKVRLTGVVLAAVELVIREIVGGER